MNLKKKFQLNQSLILSPEIKIITGYNYSIIYDFNKKKAYKVSKFAGNFIEEVFGNKESFDQEFFFQKWINKEKSNLSDKTFEELSNFIKKLKKIGVLITFEEYERKKSLTSEFQFENCISQIPVFCVLEITSQCNFFCPHCYLGLKDDIKILDFNLISKLLKQIQEIGTKEIHLTGGEPFLRKDLKDIIILANNLGLEISISTNGSLISEDLIEIVEKYVKKIHITLYSLNKATYSKFSSDPFVLDKIISTINKFHSEKPEILLVNFVMTPYNYQEINNFFQFTKEKGLDYTFGKTMPVGLALNEDLMPSASWYNSFCEENFLKNTKIESLKREKPSFKTHVCYLNQITILSNGGVTTCPLLREEDFIFGNVYNQTLKEIWFKKAIPFFESLKVDNLEICKDCEFKYLCGGECPAIWPVLKPLKEAKNPPCQSYFLTRKIAFKEV
jgi:radical SAM protein with 4Fe4S-binding SPASM domain